MKLREPTALSSRVVHGVIALAVAGAVTVFGCAQGTSGTPIGNGGEGGTSTEAGIPAGTGGAGGTTTTLAGPAGSTGGAGTSSTTSTLAGPSTSGSSTTTSASSSTTHASSSSSGQNGCKNAEECGNTATMVCDPRTRMCTAGECTATTACSGTDACLAQIDPASATVGACYAACTILGGGCSGGECVPIQTGGTDGACFGVGTGTLNGACTQDDVTSGCVSGSVCVSETTGGPTNCRQVCNFFSSPSCGAGLRCDVSEFCISTTPDPAPLDGDCDPSSDDGTPCGANANKIAGACFEGFCAKWCRLTGNDCTGGQICEDELQDGSPVGLCL